MAQEKYLTAPVPSTSMPKGIRYIIGNEAAERFSFYGMKTILFVFMTHYLVNGAGELDPMSDSEASVWYHLFTFAVYFTPLFGAILADVFLGKYLTIIILSLVYCAGHFVLAMDETRFGLSLGLGLIAVGAGGIKPCVSAHVGDQFGKTNAHLLEKVFGWFYFAINLGAGASAIATPWLLEAYGPQVAFGLPGGLMLLATWVFWLGRTEFVHIQPKGRAFLREVFSPVGVKVMTKLLFIYAFVAMFWALFDQTGSRWVQQAGHMDRHFLGMEWLPSQIQVMNPILIMVFIPIFAFWLYPAMNRRFKLTPLRKIGIGFFVTVIAFLIPAWIETEIAAGGHPNIVWQLFAYTVMTAAEVMVSITCLEFSYTQAPKVMKSWIMGLFMASVAIGNLFTAGVNHFVMEDPPGFVADKAGAYLLQVEVSDGQSSHKARVQYTAVETLQEEEYQKPEPWELFESLQDPVTVLPGTDVFLDGAAAKVQLVEGEILRPVSGKSPVWSFGSMPANSTLTSEDILHRHSKTARFSPDVEGEYMLELQVSKGGQSQGYALRVSVSTENVPPVANAGEASEVLIGDTVALNAQDSADENRDELRYNWTVLSAPAGSAVTSASLSNPSLPGTISKLSGSGYYLFFAGCMFIWGILYIPVAMWFEEETFIQEEEAS
jgi:POT family proton-dependent oligopeptide transporter